MGRLVGWELKKLRGRKILWVVLVLGMALFLFICWSRMEIYGLSGYAGGYHEVYLRYQGQTVTDAFRTQVTQDFFQYVSAHADRFKLVALDEGGPEEYAYYQSTGPWGADTGIWQAYNDLKSASTLEDNQKFLRYAEERVATGTDEQGAMLPPYQLHEYQNTVARGVTTPIVRFTRGWDECLYDSVLTGILTLACIGITLLGLFNTEATSRMEVLVLTAKHSRRVVWAKLITGVLVSVAVVALFFGLQYAVSLGIWGTEGSMLPADYHRDMPGSSAMTIGQAYALSMLFVLAMATACGAIVTWASARFRHPLVALLAAGAILGGMALAQDTWVHNSYRFASDSWSNFVNNALLLLPSIALIQTEILPYRAYTMPWPLLEFGVPLAMTVLFSLLAYRAFFRRSKI